MGETNIGWTDRSANPFLARLAGSTATKGGYSSGVGHYCEKVSAGCRNCYSSTLQPKFGLPIFQDARNGAVEHFLNAARFDEVLRRKKSTRFFWCDMTDMFGSWVPDEWIAACFGVMAATPHHTHQILTKRPERAVDWFEGSHDIQAAACAALDSIGFERGCGSAFEGDEWPLPNVHLGVSVEDQANADKRIPLLLQCPAAVRWVSYEPALGPLDLRMPALHDSPEETPTKPIANPAEPDDWKYWAARDRGISWLVAGGESGTGHRPVDPAWIDSVVAQCVAAHVSVFVKQDSGPKPGKQGRLSDETWARKEFPRAVEASR